MARTDLVEMLIPKLRRTVKVPRPNVAHYERKGWTLVHPEPGPVTTPRTKTAAVSSRDDDATVPAGDTTTPTGGNTNG